LPERAEESRVPQFLSESWFSEVERIRAEMGEVPIPGAIKSIRLNVVVTDHPEGEKRLHVAGGDFARGLLDDAPAKITLPFPVATAIFFDETQQVGVQAFMSGKVRIEGDISVMMQLQAAGAPSPEVQALRKRIREITEA
jgi:hypothetical protein